MARGSLGAVAKGVARLFGEGTVSGLSERQLLDRFLADGDALAFEALVARHGPMVLSVCRKVLRDDHAAEDAFQATFLLLVRKARSIRGADLLGPWLHRVAYRVSVRAGKGDAKRKAKETSSPDLIALAPSSESPDRDLGLALHEALDTLPEKYRAPVVLCYLEGRSHDEAAQRLSWPIGSVKGRLSRARAILKGRLERRGVAVPAGLILAGLGGETLAAVPSLLGEMTIEAAKRFAAGKTAGIAAGTFSAGAVVLAEEAARAMTIKKLLMFAASFAALGLCIGGAAVLARQDGVKPRVEQAKAAESTKPVAPKTDLDRLQGRWDRMSFSNGNQQLSNNDQPTTFREIVIRGDTLLATFDDGTLGAPRSLKFDETKTPRQVEWRRKGLGGEEVTRAIYRIDSEDGFILCFDVKDPANPPSSFDASNQDGRLKMTFSRNGPDPVMTPEQKSELEKLQGEWMFKGGERNGEVFTDKELRTPGMQNLRIKIEGDKQTTYYINPIAPNGPLPPEATRLIALDLSKAPPILETRNTREVIRSGRNAGMDYSHAKVHRSSYKLEGDVLILCSNLGENLDVAPPEFVTRPGDGRSLSIYRRVPKSSSAPLKAAIPPADILSRLEGLWDDVSFEQDGKVTKTTALAAKTLPTLISNRSWRPLGTSVLEAWTMRTVEKRPDVLELTALRVGEHPVRRILFKLDGDTLTICTNLAEAATPGWIDVTSDFRTRPNDGKLVKVMKRRSAAELLAAIAQEAAKQEDSRRIEAAVKAESKTAEKPPKDDNKGTDATGGMPGAAKAEKLRSEASSLSAEMAHDLATIEDLEAKIEFEKTQWSENEKKLRAVETSGRLSLGPGETKEARNERDEANAAKIAQHVEMKRSIQAELDAYRRELQNKRRNLDGLGREIKALNARADEAAKRPGKPNTIQVGDILIVEVLECLPGRPVTGEHIVRPDGTISLGFYGDLKVEGLTRKEIKIKVIERMVKFVTDESIGIVAEDPETGKTIAVKPEDSDRVYVDDSPTFDPSMRGQSPFRPASGSLESKLDAILHQLHKK